MASKSERDYTRAKADQARSESAFNAADLAYRAQPSVSGWVQRQTAQIKMFRAIAQTLTARKQWARCVDEILKNEVNGTFWE